MDPSFWKDLGQIIIFHQPGPNGLFYPYMGVSKNNGTPKSSVLIEFSIINHPFWGTTIFGNTILYFTNLDFPEIAGDFPSLATFWGEVAII